MQKDKYLMESDIESLRLDIKVNKDIIRRQAKWAGIKPGMRVADLGCGPGAITSILHELVQPGGSVVGVDSSNERLEYARTKYGKDGIDFVTSDLTSPLNDIGTFDFIWVRFVLEYHLSRSFEMVQNFSRCLKPGGTMCLIDLDHNLLNYFGANEKLDRTFRQIMKKLEESFDFDSFIGRKLYSFLYDLNFQDIDVNVENHRVSFGKIDEFEVFNMLKKIELVPKKINFIFDEFPGGYKEFYLEAEAFMSDPRRFGYTPLILCRGLKPLQS
jgi:ubiquinone/menaquinone biosynthesis C-methylase UbiE